VQVPTGGKPQSKLMKHSFIIVEARERLSFYFKKLEVSRSGVIPGPTVIVRMGEINEKIGLSGPQRYFIAIACYLHGYAYSARRPDSGNPFIFHCVNEVILP
jgi:hypothetical protein